MSEPTDQKQCRRCGEQKPSTEFVRDKSRPDGRYPYCIPCHRTSSKGYRDRRTPEQKAWAAEQDAERRRIRDANDEVRAKYLSDSQTYALQKRYGISTVEYLAMMEAQGGRCAICGETPDPNAKKGRRRLGVDHDHTTGAVRGLLCFPCNVGLGNFKDNVDVMSRAIAYLGVGATPTPPPTPAALTPNFASLPTPDARIAPNS